MNHIKTLAFFLTLMVCPLGAWADFSGAYAPSNWSTTLAGAPPGGGGHVDITGAPAYITLQGGDDGCPDLENCYVEYTIAAPTNANLSFKWDYVSSDADGPSYDLFLVRQNGDTVQLSDNDGGSTQSGTYSVTVSAGQVFGFRLDCTDCAEGPASVTISDFTTAPAPVGAIQAVPTLQEWALIGMAALMGLFALGSFRRKRQS